MPMDRRDTIEQGALQVARHLYDHDVRMFSFVGAAAAILVAPLDDEMLVGQPLQIYISMSSSLRIWEERVLLPYTSVFARSPAAQRGRWTVTVASTSSVELEILRENPSFYLLGAPTIASKPPQTSDDLKELVPELPLLLADALRDWRERLDNAPQVQLVRFFTKTMQGAGVRFGWRHPGPEATEIALEFLDDLDGEDAAHMRAQFIAIGLRLEQEN